MANPFDFVIVRLNSLGFFQLLLFVLTSAVFYGLLRKSKLFGEPDKNIVVNGVVSLVAAFLVWSAPTLLGIDIQTSTTTFFVQGISATLVVMVALMITGMFAPEGLGKVLQESLKGKFLSADIGFLHISSTSRYFPLLSSFCFSFCDFLWAPFQE